MSEKSLSPRRSRSFLLRRILVAALCLACSAILALAATSGAPPATGERLAAELPVFGVAVRGEWNNGGVRDLVRQSGVTWARTSVSWAAVQPSPEVFYWAGPDAELQLARDAGVVPLVLVWQNPSWAASTTCGRIYPTQMQNFYNFVYALASRYNGTTVVNGAPLPRVDYWEFYNEPDNQLTSEASVGGCWGSYGPEYAQMLKQAWAAVHAANPQGNVVFGAVAAEDIAYGSSAHMFNFNILGNDFVDAVLTYVKNNPSSPNQYFDFFDFHYFPAFHTVWDPYGAGLIGKATYYRSRMFNKGVVRPLMCSESGCRSDPGQVIDRVAGSDDEQSRYVVRLFTQGMSAGLLNVLWFTLADIVEPKQSGAAAWGLLTQDLLPKPSYTAYRTLTRELSSLRYKGLASFKGEIEGYVFSADNRETTVLWAKSGSIPVSFRASQVTVINLHGEETTVLDGGNGDTDRRVDGVVTIALTQNPVFVRRQP